MLESALALRASLSASNDRSAARMPERSTSALLPMLAAEEMIFSIAVGEKLSEISENSSLERAP